MMANVSEHDRKANVLYFPGIEAKVREHPVRLFPSDFVVADHFLPRKKK